MSLIESVTVGSGGAASIGFTSIPQDGTDLVIYLTARANSSTPFGERLVSMTLNGNFDSSAKSLRGNGSAASSISEFYGLTVLSSYTANTFSNNYIYISNYTSSANKTVLWDAVTENNATASEQHISAGLYSVTSAITSLTLFGNFVQNSTASLYKVTKGSDGIVTTS
jgi:hypothetical protein